MAKQILEVITDRFKKLPGFGWLLAGVTLLYVKAFGTIDLEWENAAVLAICWAGYRLGGRLDKPLYDSLFGPTRTKRQRRLISKRQKALDESRDKVVGRLFEPVLIKNYGEAREKGRITETGNTTLYRRCEALLKPTKLWEQRVKTWLEISKATRALIVLLPVFAVVLAVSTQGRLLTARQNLGVLGVWWIHLIVAVGAIPVFLATRYRHHHQLYETVAEKVKHTKLADGQIRAEIVEDALIV